jgi:hypothetical protein
MQKSSTMRVRGSRIFKGSQLTIGMDLGDRSSCYCVLMKRERSHRHPAHLQHHHRSWHARCPQRQVVHGLHSLRLRTPWLERQ